jgi:hypothetical protein
MTPAPRTVGRTSLGIRFQEMMQDVQQLQHAPLIGALLRGADVLNDHIAYFFLATLLMHEALRQGGSRHRRQMLMLGDGEDLLLGQAAKRNAIVERDHVICRTFRVQIEWTVLGQA